MGQQPMALEFLEFMTPRNIVGIFQKGENNYLLIFRNVEGSLRLAYHLTVLTNIIGEKLRNLEVPQRISYDNKKPQALQANKGKGKGKAQANNQGKGKGNQGRGNKGKGKNRSRSPRNLGPVGAAPPNPPVPPAEAAAPPPPNGAPNN